MIAPGRYLARAVKGSQQFGVSKNKGTNFVQVTLSIVDPSTREATPEQISWTGHFTGKTEARTCESLGLLGMKDLDDTDGLGSTVVSIVVEEETYTTDAGEKRTSMKVRWINPAGARALSPEVAMDDGARRVLAARMRGHFAAAGRAAAGRGNDDDIPF